MYIIFYKETGKKIRYWIGISWNIILGLVQAVVASKINNVLRTCYCSSLYTVCISATIYHMQEHMHMRILFVCLG